MQRISKIILKKKTKVREHTLPDFRSYYKAILKRKCGINKKTYLQIN